MICWGNFVQISKRNKLLNVTEVFFFQIADFTNCAYCVIDIYLSIDAMGFLYDLFFYGDDCVGWITFREKLTNVLKPLV